MNVRKPTDYSAMYGILDQLMGAEFPQMELYFEIGKIVCAHPEKLSLIHIWHLHL